MRKRCGEWSRRASRKPDMRLYTSSFAPNPRRVSIFIAEKGVEGIEPVLVDLGTGQHRSADFLQKNPFGRVPALELDDGRVLAETRAICTYLEGLHPAPNLMGENFEERAFIEMADRRIELYLFAGIATACATPIRAWLPWSSPSSPNSAPPRARKCARRRAGSMPNWRASPTSPGSASPSPTSPPGAPLNSAGA